MPLGGTGAPPTHLSSVRENLTPEQQGDVDDVDGELEDPDLSLNLLNLLTRGPTGT